MPPCEVVPSETKYLTLSVPPLMVIDCLDCLAGGSTSASYQFSGLLVPFLKASIIASGKSGGVPSKALLSFSTFIYSKTSADFTFTVGDWYECVVEKSKDGFPVFPRLVVTRITPPADCAPYTAADASFSTDMVSISLGSSLFNPSGSALATPSITINAELLR